MPKEYVPEVPDVYRSDVESLDHPVVLRVAVTVLVCPKRMSDSLERVHDRAGEIVSGVNLPLRTAENGQNIFVS